MSSEIFSQIKNHLERSQHILVVFKEEPDFDSIVGSLALATVLRDSEKQVSLACVDFRAPDELKFLSDIDLVRSKLENLRKFIISLDTSKTSISELSYDKLPDKLKIIITPKDDIFSADDVTAEKSDWRFDLIIVLDTPHLDQLGSLLKNNRDFFQSTPIINIDHHSSNEHYGQINLVDIKATSTSEIVYNFLIHTYPKKIDKNTATQLFVGLITKTRAFKSPYITPRTLEITSELLALGADREQVVRHVYQSRKLSTLKLWGRVLARLKYDKNIKTVWSLINHNDFVKSGATPADIRGVVEELVSTVPGSQLNLVLYQQPQPDSPDQMQTWAQFFTSPNYDALDLMRKFSPTGSRDFARFKLSSTNLYDAEKEAIDELRKKLAEYN